MRKFSMLIVKFKKIHIHTLILFFVLIWTANSIYRCRHPVVYVREFLTKKEIFEEVKKPYREFDGRDFLGLHPEKVKIVTVYNDHFIAMLPMLVAHKLLPFFFDSEDVSDCWDNYKFFYALVDRSEFSAIPKNTIFQSDSQINTSELENFSKRLFSHEPNWLMEHNYSNLASLKPGRFQVPSATLG